MASNKFPKRNMEIRTSHSYVLRNFFGTWNMKKVNPTGDYNLDNIIVCLGLREECKRIFGTALMQEGSKLLDRRVNTIAGYIRNTLRKFQASADDNVTQQHVFWRAKQSYTERTKWRKQVSACQYVNWAAQFFARVKQRCWNIREGNVDESDIEVSHDAYLKVAQLATLQLDYDVIFVDEAQDMTACQASFLWAQQQIDGNKEVAAKM